jgi:hypothetical protein
MGVAGEDGQAVPPAEVVPGTAQEDVPQPATDQVKMPVLRMRR